MSRSDIIMVLMTLAVLLFLFLAFIHATAPEMLHISLYLPG